MANDIEVVNEKVPLSIADMKQHLNLIQEAMREVMKEGEDYGVIPGTPKPTLLKPGAEKLNLLFRLDPEYEIQETYEPTQEGPKHYTVVSKCTLFHAPSGRRLGSGYGSCSTKEKKYAYREAKRVCPKCSKTTIFKSKEAGKGWYCWAKMNGCGAQFPDGETTIESQTVGFILNPDLADQYNTILKMANKRSLVAASLNVTGASAIFTQDVEDMVPYQDKKEPLKDAKKPEESQTITGSYPWMFDLKDGKITEVEEGMAGPMDWLKHYLGETKSSQEVRDLMIVAKATLDEAGYKTIKTHADLVYKAWTAKEKKEAVKA